MPKHGKLDQTNEYGIRRIECGGCIIETKNEDTHTIYEIANHLCFYNERWLKRFKGEPLTENSMDNASTFKTVDDLSEESWLNLVHQLDVGLSSWEQIIQDSTESKLHEQIPTFPEDAIWWEALSNLCTHNTYHIGQIIYIRKAQGSWKSKQK